jgi:sugar lactone lactonase YvrE
MTSGTAGSSGSAGATGGAGQNQGGAGSTSTAGGATGGSGGATGGSGGSGGGSSGSGGATGGGTSGAGGTVQTSDGGSTNLTDASTGGKHGGAAARFVCPPGATYGNPLTGMGAVTQIMAPTTGPATYFAFIEGPVWIGSLGTLFFSDNASSPTERIWKLVPPSTTPQVFLENSGSNGLAVDNDDKIIITDQRAKRLTRVDPSSPQMVTVVVPVGNYKPNDVIVRSDNNIYFTDPDQGFFRASPSGMVTGPMKQVNRPNGVELSLDENTLYVGDVGNQKITSFPLMADGTVDTANSKLFATAQGNTVDGMAIDCAGNLYAGTNAGVEVFSPTGMSIGVVPTGESSNATFGGADRKTLYVTSRSVLKTVTLAVPGLPD